jgi:hypothetical protein
MLNIWTTPGIEAKDGPEREQRARTNKKNEGLGMKAVFVFQN